MPRYREIVKRTVEAQELTFRANFTDDRGDTVVAEIGDFLVCEADGTQSVMDPDEFNRTFELIKTKGPKPVGEACDTDELEETASPKRGRPRKSEETLLA